MSTVLGAEQTEDVRLAVYDHFRRTGGAASNAELANATGLVPQDIRIALQDLHAHRDIVLDDAGALVMAHPFSSIPLGFSVMGTATLWWGGCAWDSFAVPHLLPEEPSVLVATTCPGCAAALAWVVSRDEPPAGDEVAHFLTPVARIWDDVVRSCGNQRIFCRESCVSDWLQRASEDRGYVMDLATLWRLARGWYAGRLERGYRRREPTAAATYFGDVGLSGPFWGLV
ncbi:MAG: putative transrane protein [Pseudonocardiales bacterium]|nr:putative transrane protein [Pseudonocardiales bacterium]